MTRILLIETASPRRVRQRAEEILAGQEYPSPEVTILCRPEAGSVEHLSAIPGAKIVPLEAYAGKDILRGLRQTLFDTAVVFWTGEKKYRSMKRVAFRIQAKQTIVEIGDGSRMRLTPGNFLRFLPIRWKYPRPTDYARYLFEVQTSLPGEADSQDWAGERILILQSAEPGIILKALDRMRENPFFVSPRFTVFCRNRLEIIARFRGHPMIHEIISHSETRAAWKNLMELRRRRFHGVVVFFTGDPSYWKIKYLMFLVGAPRKLIYNEFEGCFFLDWKLLYRHWTYRLKTHCGVRPSSRWTEPVRFPATILLKLALFPFRFFWLLGMWAWLRSTALKDGLNS